MDYQDLMNRALEARKNAYNPYSNYGVGACVALKDGTFIIGANIENAAYGSTMCAERNAIYATYSQGYRRNDILAIAIAGKGDDVCTPCGACRQVLAELLDKQTPVILSNEEKYIVTNMEELLPRMFTGEFL